MGTAEKDNAQLVIYSNIITYGNAANTAITRQLVEEIETLWNEPKATLNFHGVILDIRFIIAGSYEARISDIDIYQNTDPRNNYFRIEEFAFGNISFVDGCGCNSGYFKLENLYPGSTTAAHEYGHTLGLDHPTNIDLRGKGIPGIMYPRGTLVDPPYQYDPLKPAGTNGGTMHPQYRKVLQQDIDLLKLHHLSFNNNQAIIGEFTNVWHDDHANFRMEDDL